MGAVEVKRLRLIAGRYYWRPTPALKKLGYGNRALGSDITAAVRQAEALNREADALLAGREVPEAGRKGTIDDLIDRYKTSEAWDILKPASRTVYEVVLREIGRRDGRTMIADVTRQGLRKTYAGLRRARSIHVAHLHIGVWKALLRFAHDEGDVAVNPSHNLRFSKPDSRTVLWTQEELGTVIAAAEGDGQFSLAMAIRLLYDLGQRPADIVVLPWRKWDGDGFVITQSKTGQTIFVPVSAETKELLRKVERKGPLVLVREDGKPWTVRSLGRTFRALCRRHGLPAKQIRDIRRTAATEIGAGGGTDTEIMSVTGHRSRQTVTVYTLPTSAAARAAQAKRRRTKEE